MRPAAAAVVLALVGTAVRIGIAGVTPTPPPGAWAPPRAGEPGATLAPPDPGPAPPPPMRELSAEVPDDVKFEVRAEGDAIVRVHVRRAGHLVALRRLDARSAGAEEASLPVLRSELTDAALVWETTRLEPAESSRTTRGVLRLDVDGKPRSRLAESPAVVPRDERRKHRCWSYADGFGGSTVLCRIAAYASAANVTGEDPLQDAWAVPNIERSLVRLDLPAPLDAAEARVVGYVDGRTAVVIRAESSFLPGEAGPSLTVLSAEREQRPVAHFPRRHMREEPFFF